MIMIVVLLDNKKVKNNKNNSLIKISKKNLKEPKKSESQTKEKEILTVLEINSKNPKKLKDPKKREFQ